MGEPGSDEDPEEAPVKGANGRNKSRRELPAGAVATLKAWLLSPEHFTHPYPTPQDQAMLMQKTGIDKKQLKNWFTNARRRIWKPMLKKQIEQGKLQATGAGGGGVALPGIVPGLMVPAMHGAIAPQHQQPGQPTDFQQNQEQMRVNYQQAIQQAGATQQHQEMNAFGSHSFVQHQPQQHQQQHQQPQAVAPAPGNPDNPGYYNHQQPPQAQLRPQPQTQPHQMQGQMSSDQSTLQPNLAQQGRSGQQQPDVQAGATIMAMHAMPSQGQQTMSKTDSHAVLMELFARDQDLVREAAAKRARRDHHPPQSSLFGGTQAGRGPLSDAVDPENAQQQQQSSSKIPTGGALGPSDGGKQAFGQQHQPGQLKHDPSSMQPVKSPSQSRLVPVPTLNSWPHFSSISSLNNLGTMPGVKSITSLSGVDLASQGPVNRVGNLAQVKSQESMGKADSYAFLEVLFDGSASSNNMASLGSGLGSSSLQLSGGMTGGAGGGDSGGAGGGILRWMKREEDNDVGLSLEDEGPPATSPRQDVGARLNGTGLGEPAPPSFLPSSAGMKSGPSNGLKRSHEATMAARGLLAVSRSSEKLTDLVLPPKIQRSLSREFMRHDMQQQQQQQQQTMNFTAAAANAPAAPSHNRNEQMSNNQQGQVSRSGQPMPAPTTMVKILPANTKADKSASNPKVQVPTATKCALCHQTNVNTQLRPCGHMFHEKCLNPALQSQSCGPKCPVDHIPIQSAVLAVPTDETQPTLPLGPPNGTPVPSAIPPSSSLPPWNPAPSIPQAHIKSES